jgi:anti-sigma B factor antagonist
VHLVVPPLRITTAQLGVSAYVVSVTGELDVSNAKELEEECDRVIDRGATRLVVDLVGLSFIDSIALGALTKADKRIRAEGGECVVAADDPRIRRVFAITGLDRTFRIERSLAEAIEELLHGVAAH